MYESHAIMKFVCEFKKLPDHWYPTSPGKDLEMRTKMDMYLDWHHSNVRVGSAFYFFRKYVAGLTNKDGTWPSEEKVNEAY